MKRSIRGVSFGFLFGILFLASAIQPAQAQARNGQIICDTTFGPRIDKNDSPQGIKARDAQLLRLLADGQPKLICYNDIDGDLESTAMFQKLKGKVLMSDYNGINKKWEWNIFLVSGQSLIWQNRAATPEEVKNFQRLTKLVQQRTN